MEEQFFSFEEEFKDEALNFNYNPTNPSACSAVSQQPHNITQISQESLIKPNLETVCFDTLYEDKEKFRCRTIVFTCYDKNALDDPEAWLRTLQKSCAWTLGQLEKCPKTGRVHIQGMANSKQPLAWQQLKGQSTWKRQCIAPEASIKYCSKSKSQLDGPWEFGERPKFGQQAKSETAKLKNQAKVQAIVNGNVEQLVASGDISWKDYLNAKKFKQAYMANVKAQEQKDQPIDHGMPHEWIWGPTGTGKTTYARTTYPDHYLKDKNKWWDDYIGQETVIIEDLGKKDAEWIGDRLKIWADKWPFKAEFKNGTMDSIRPKRIIVTSNYHIKDLWEDPQITEPLERRFNIGLKNNTD